MSDMASVLDIEFNLHQHLFIEASAGTGKTFTIQHLVVRKVLEAAETLLPKQCAIVTFTRAVAEELITRISQTLDQVISGLRESRPTVAYLEPYLLSEEDRSRALNRLLLFRRDIDSAQITTIHGFCLNLIKRFEGFSGGMQEGWIDTNEQKKLVEELLEIETTASVITPGQFQAVRKMFGYDDSRLITALLSPDYNKDKTGQLNIHADIHAIIEHLSKKNITPEIVYSTLDALSLGFTAIRDRQGQVKEEVKEHFLALSELFDEQTRKEALYRLERSCLSLPELFSKPLKKQAEKSSKLPFEDELMYVLSPALEKHTSQKNALNRLRESVLEGFERICQTRGLLTPDLLIKKIFQLTQNDPIFRDFARSELELVVVDEFQDTDPLQWGILNKIFLNKDEDWTGTLYLVGDPKQSIYAFRAADVYSYLEARDVITAQKSLKTNYRSTQSLVCALNTIFTGPWASKLFYLPKALKSLPVEKVTAVRTAADSSSPLQIALFYGALGRKRSWPTDDLEQQHIFPWIVQQLHTLKTKGYAFSQIAILVKDRFQAFRLENVLEKNHIPATALKTLSVLESPAVDFLKVFYGWLSSPKKLSCLKQLLSFQRSGFASPLFTLLDSPSQGLDLFGAYVSDVESILQAARKHGVTASFDRFLQTVLYPYDITWADMLSARPDADQFFRDCNLALDLLAEAEQNELFDVEKAYNYVCNLETKFDGEQLQRRFDPRRDSVTIVTTHKSKGLEFDVVIPLGIACRSPEPSEMDGSQRVREREAEKARLLYVALTRARELVLLPVCIETDGKPIPYGAASPLDHVFHAIATYDQPGDDQSIVLTLDLIESGCRKLHAASEGAITFGQVDLKEVAFTPSKELAVEVSPAPLPTTEWACQKRSSFSKLYQSDKNHSYPLATSSEENGRLIGIFVHDLMQKLIEQKWQLVQDSFLLSNWLEAEVTQAGLGSQLAKNIFAALFTPIHIGDREIILAHIPKSALIAEMPFCIQEGKELVSGSIDCVVSLEEGLFALDWKTHLISTSLDEAASQLGCMSQAKIYRRALELFSGDGHSCLGVHFVFVRMVNEETCRVVSF